MVSCAEIFDPLDAAALLRVQDHHRRSAASRAEFCVLHRRGNLVDIVAVFDVDHVPAECSPFFVQRRDAVDFLDRAVDLQLVVVGKGDQVIQMLARRKHGRFPDLSFLALAVADQRIDRCAVAFELAAQSNAHRAGKALTERTRRHVDADCAVHVAVARQVRAAAVQRQKLRLIEVAAIAERRVHRGTRMPFRADKAVASRLFRLVRVDVHCFKIQHGQKLDDRKAAADVTDAQASDAGQNIAADVLCDFLQILFQSFVLLFNSFC